jgi:hypothetical protein
MCGIPDALWLGDNIKNVEGLQMYRRQRQSGFINKEKHRGLFQEFNPNLLVIDSYFTD